SVFVQMADALRERINTLPLSVVDRDSSAQPSVDAGRSSDVVAEPERIVEWQGRASAAIEAGNYDEAVTILDRLLKVAPTANGYNQLGAAHAAQRRLPQAESCFRQAIALDSCLAEAHYNLSIVCRRRG